MNSHIIETDADPRYFQVEDDTLADYADEMEDLLYRAYGDGLVITVEQTPTQPLAMGHFHTEFVVRPMRKPTGWPNNEVPDSHPLARLFEHDREQERASMAERPRRSSALSYFLLACVIVGTIALVAIKA